MEARNTPQFVFICGPVGCGNTFLFRSLTQDERGYGVNEGNLVNTLRALLNSHHSGYPLPHATAAFTQFMTALAAGRERFIDKAPATLRHQDELRQTLERCHFLCTVREPRAALTSALSGRSVVHDVEHVARLWQSDCRRMEQRGPEDLLIVYEDFITAPQTTLERIEAQVMPLSREVYRFADRMARPDRTDAERWRAKVDGATAEAIEHWVSELDLDGVYASFRSGEAGAGVGGRASASLSRTGYWRRARAEVFAAYDKLRRKTQAASGRLRP